MSLFLGGPVGNILLMSSFLKSIYYRNIFYYNLAQVSSGISFRILNSENFFLNNYFIKNLAVNIDPSQKDRFLMRETGNGKGMAPLLIYALSENAGVIIKNNSFLGNYASQIGKNIAYFLNLINKRL